MRWLVRPDECNERITEEEKGESRKVEESRGGKKKERVMNGLGHVERIFYS